MSPLYRKLEDDIRSRITSGEWKANTKIPSELEICELLNLSRSTVRKSIDSLVREGYLERVKGKGTYVKARQIEQKLSKFYSFSEELNKKGLREVAKLQTFHIVPAPKEVAENLRIREEDKVYEIIRTRLVDDVVYAYEDSYIPLSLAEEMTGEMITENGLYRTMDLFHIRPDEAVEKLTAVVAGEEIRKYLKSKDNEACMHIQRIAFNQGRPVEFCDSYTKGDMFSYTVELK